MGSSARDPAARTSCVTQKHAPLVQWTSEPSSAQSTTASPLEAGTTSGNPTPKWKVQPVGDTLLELCATNPI